MEQKIIDQVYETLTGMVEGTHAMPNVPNAFADGSYCMNKYEDVYEAHVRLCEKLNNLDGDDDVEIIISSMFDIQKKLCHRIYEIAYQAGRQSHPVKKRCCIKHRNKLKKKHYLAWFPRKSKVYGFAGK